MNGNETGKFTSPARELDWDKTILSPGNKTRTGVRSHEYGYEKWLFGDCTKPRASQPQTELAAEQEMDLYMWADLQLGKR